MHVIVAEVEDEGILGMDFLSQADSHIDIVKNQVSINGEVFDCSDFKNQPLSSTKSKGISIRHAIVRVLRDLTFVTKGPVCCKDSGGWQREQNGSFTCFQCF